MRNLFLIVIFFFSFSVYGEVEKIVILGSGPSGLTAALFAGQAKLNPLVIEGAKINNQLAAIYRIENFPGFPEGISGDELGNKMRLQAEIFGARVQSGVVSEAHLENWPFQIVLSDGQEILTETLVVATGAAPRWLDVEGEKEMIGRGVSASAVMDAHMADGKHVIVVGGGDSAMEQALILSECANRVTIIYNQEKFYASRYLQERVFNNAKIESRFNTEIISIHNEHQEYVTGVTLRNVRTGQQEPFLCDGVFVSNGRVPNTKIFEGQIEMTSAGYIVTKPDCCETSISGVFAAGDISHKAYRKVITAAASGCMAALDAIRFLKGKNN